MHSRAVARTHKTQLITREFQTQKIEFEPLPLTKAYTGTYIVLNLCIFNQQPQTKPVQETPVILVTAIISLFPFGP